MSELRTVHTRVTAVSRGKGDRICAKAAYAEKTTITDSALGKDFCYARRNAKSYTTTYRLGSFLPNGTPIKTSDLWNMAEAAEKRANACTGRAIELSLLNEASHEQNCAMLEDLRRWMADRWGVASTIAIHYEHENNIHAHILITSRTVEANGTFGKKTRILDDKATGSKEIEAMRQHWASLMNAAITDDAPKWTHESFEARGIDRDPQIHLGPKCAAMLKKGIVTQRAERNFDIDEKNAAKAIAEEQRAIIAELDKQIAAFERNDDTRAGMHGGKPEKTHTEQPGARLAQPDGGSGGQAGEDGSHAIPDSPHAKPASDRTPAADSREHPAPRHEAWRSDDKAEAPAEGQKAGAGPVPEADSRGHSGTPSLGIPNQGLPRFELADHGRIYDLNELPNTGRHCAALTRALETLADTYQLEAYKEAQDEYRANRNIDAAVDALLLAGRAERRGDQRPEPKRGNSAKPKRPDKP